jgi:vacuolar-type H+-ATPase subunit E/Vma4
MQLNASRIKVLQAQDDLVMNMMESARKELLYISRDDQSYKKLLKILIVQVSGTKFAFVYADMKHERSATTTSKHLI